MVFSRKKLEEDLVKHNAKKRKEEEESDRKQKDWASKWLAQDILRASTLLDGELGEALMRWYREGIKTVKIDQSKVWWDDDREFYGANFELGFKVNPDYEPTKMLVRLLIKAGFKARIETKQVQNHKFVIIADGYDIVEEPGTHPSHKLVIDWS